LEEFGRGSQFRWENPVVYWEMFEKILPEMRITHGHLMYYSFH